MLISILGQQDFNETAYDELDFAEQSILREKVFSADTSQSGPRPWYNNVNLVFVLGCDSDIPLVSRALEEALSKINGEEPVCPKFFIAPACELAARGAALRAREWIEYWEEENQKLAHKSDFERYGFHCPD